MPQQNKVEKDMKEKILLILFLLLSLTTGMNAANSARQTLDKAAAKVPLSSGAYATFSVSGNNIHAMQGTIAIKGNKFNASTGNAIIWFDGKTQWIYNKKSQEVNVSSPKGSQIASMNPYFFLTLYKKGYSLKQTNTSNGYTIYICGGNKGGIKEMYVTVDKQYNIKNIKIKQGQQWITITVKGLHARKYTDSTFRFNAKDYPKAEVIDLR